MVLVTTVVCPDVMVEPAVVAVVPGKAARVVVVLRRVLAVVVDGLVLMVGEVLVTGRLRENL